MKYTYLLLAISLFGAHGLMGMAGNPPQQENEDKKKEKIYIICVCKKCLELPTFKNNLRPVGPFPQDHVSQRQKVTFSDEQDPKPREKKSDDSNE